MSRIKYRITVKTSDVWLGGTDNKIFMKMCGDRETAPFELLGDQERNQEETQDYYYDDIGSIKWISLDVEGTLADKWNVAWIKILRIAGMDDAQPDGMSEFLINQELGYDEVKFYADTLIPPQISISPSGEAVDHTERITLVQFDHNPGQSSQTVMKYEETWNNIEKVMVSNEERNSVEVSAKLTWESPKTVAGKFGSQVGTAWKNTMVQIRETVTQEVNSRKFDWSFEADPKSYVFRLQVFKVPYTDQLYQFDEAGKEQKRVIRKLRSEVIPAGVGDFLFIPRMDKGRVVPIPLSELEDDWLYYMEAENRKWIIDRHMGNWLAKGWVTMENYVLLEEMKGLVVTDALNIREDHDPNARILGHLKMGDEVSVVDTWTEGNNIWVKLKPDAHLPNPAVQWSAMLIGKNRYIKLIDEFANLPE